MKKVSLLILVSMILLLAFTSCDVLPETVTGPLNNVKDTVVTTFNNVKNTVVGTFNDVKDKVEIAIGTHEHEWTDATCTSPKTCRCGETQGEALGHDYSDATCYEPQTCKNCGETLGIELVHNWVSATCTDPKTCLRCGLTEGEALGHDWKDATCTKPSTCSRCKETSGEPNGHTIVGATCTVPQHCTVCGAVGQDALGHDYSGATCQNPESKCSRCDAIEENPEIKHNVTHYDAVEATCHQNGNVEYWVCEDCECVWTDEALTQVSNRRSVVVPYDVDNVVHVDKVEASCHQNGSEEYWYCVECDAVFADAALRQLTNRRNLTISYNAENVVHVDKVEPSCHQNGSEEYWYCVECEAVFADAALRQLTNRLNLTIPYNAENIVHVDKVEAACHQNGCEEYWYCVECDAVFADAALRQLTNRRNLTISYNAENIIYVEAKDANCTDTNGHYEYWYCAECEAVFADAALRQLTNRLNLTIPYGHIWVDATCDAPKTCTRCGDTEGEAIAHHNPIASFENGLIKYTCATCDESYLASVGHIYTGENTNWDFALNDGNRDVISIDVVDGEYHITSNDPAKNPQYMLYLPHSNRTDDKLFKDFTCANNALGVISFRAKTNLQSAFRLIVMEARNGNSSWNTGSWTGNSMDILAIQPAKDGVVNVTGHNVTGNVLGSVSVGEDNWSEWIDIKVFIQLTSDNKCTILYYINGEFANVYTRDLTDPENPQTLNDYMIECVYICGNVTGENAGVIFDDLAISYTTNSEWKFDEHEHVWNIAAADCENDKYCTICGFVDAVALGHTNSEVKIENVDAPTCTATGSHDEVVYCAVCEKELSRETKVDAALGHDEAVVVPGNAATCTETGLTDGANCSRCGITTKAQEIIPALNHIDEDLNEVCDRCEADLSCHHVGTETETVTGKAATCTEPGLTDGVKCLECGDWITAPVAIPALGHTEAEAARENVTLPTCTEAGKYDSVVYCSVCNTEISREVGVVDPALGHDEISHEAQAPTCTEIGWDAYVTCSRCDYTTKVELAAKGHSFASATCTAPETCTGCGQTKGEKNAENHVALVRKLVDNVIVYSCDCGYTFTVKTGDYSDGTNYNGISANAPDNSKYYTSNTDKTNYPALSEGGYLEFVRKTDVEGAANNTCAQVQLWLPTTGGANKYAGFNSANNAVGYLSFKINAYVDKNFEMQLVDNTTDYYDVNGDGVVDNATERIRWGDLWAIKDPVFRVSTVTNGKTELKGFNGVVLTTVDVDENNYTGWVDVAIQLTLDPVSDTVIAKYFINGKYVTTSSRPLSIHSNGINAVYVNSNNTAAGTGYKIDDLAFGYTAHEHDFSYVEENGTLVYTCPCGAEYSLLSEYREWNGDGNDAYFNHSPNGKFDTVYNEDGTWGFIFNPVTESDWKDYNGLGGQLQPWMPDSNRNEHTLSGFSCENNAVGVIAFTMKTNVTRLENTDTCITLGVGKPRNASDWNDGGSWTDDQITILCIEEYLETGVVIKGGVNSSMKLATIPVADGWSEWFDVMISIEMLDTGYMNTYYYINGVYCGMYSRDLSKADADGRLLNPKKIEAFQFSGWTYAANTGILFDDLVFGYTAGGHNTLDGQYHKLTETNCGEKSVCSCGWTGYTLDHDLTEATCVAPATCKVCGLTVGSALPHTLLPEGDAITCTECNGSYKIDNSVSYSGEGEGYGFYYGKNGNMPLVNNNGVYEAIFNTEQAMPDISEVPVNDKGEPVAGSVVGEWAWNGKFGAQYMYWLPNNAKGSGLSGFSCANNSVGLLSFEMSTNVTGAFNVSLAKARGDSDWSGWGTSELKVLNVGGYSANGIVLKGGVNNSNTTLATIPVADGWSEWFKVDIMISLKSDNTVTLAYYINGEYVTTVSGAMNIDSYDIRVAYINGWTFALNTGIKLDNFVFGSSTKGFEAYTESFYTEEIAKEDVASSVLQTVVTNKIKQWDQSSAHNSANGTPVFVKADKNGEEVTGVYFSKTTPWVGDESEQFSEFRVMINGEAKEGPKVTGFSFSYKIDGTVEKNDRYTFTDLKGEKFSADAYVQIKTAANHPLAGDNYPELSGTDLILDGEWHEMTVAFDEPLQLTNILFNLYHFQGELIIADLVVDYEQLPFYTEEIAKEEVASSVLQTVVTNKIKQWDQSEAHNSANGTPVFVKADKNGEEVTGVYFSKTTPWVGDESEQFSEFRVMINGEAKTGPQVTGFSFSYKIDGTVEKNDRYTFTDLKGEKFSADAYVQIKTASNHPLAGDNYPELSGTDLILDGEWHEMTIAFDEPLQLTNILFNLYHFQGELIIADLVIEYAE